MKFSRLDRDEGMMGSRWRAQTAELRKRLPHVAMGRQISGIVQTIAGTGKGGLNRISGLTYTAVMGHEHPIHEDALFVRPPRPIGEALGTNGPRVFLDQVRPWSEPGHEVSI